VRKASGSVPPRKMACTSDKDMASSGSAREFCSGHVDSACGVSFDSSEMHADRESVMDRRGKPRNRQLIEHVS
jgi:hypothetical protein